MVSVHARQDAEQLAFHVIAHADDTPEEERERDVMREGTGTLWDMCERTVQYLVS